MAARGNLPEMPRDLKPAYPHAKQPTQMNTSASVTSASVSASAPPPPSRSRAKDAVSAVDTQDFAQALARRQQRLDQQSSANGALATGLELHSANDRVALLERRLLAAEEAICHLKAEKLAALRDVERLSTQREPGGEHEDIEEQRRLVLELETRMAEQKQAHVLEQEQRMAVIRDQEEELKALRTQLASKTDQFAELQQRHMDLLELDEQVTMMPRVTSGVSQFSIYGEESEFSIYGEESDEDDEQKVTKSHSDRIAGRSRAPADADVANSKWQEELVRHPTPHFDLESPEVAYLLRAWTKDIKKMRYLRRWLIQVVVTKGPLPKDFPLGVELPRLPPEVRDGFLTLVLPLLRKQTEREIQAHFRAYNDGVHTDLRFRVVPRE